MLRTLIFGLALVQAPGGSLEEACGGPAAGRAEASAWGACVRAAATRLERSKEPAEAIAIAASVACSGEKRLYQAAFTSCLGASKAASLAADVEKTMRDAAVARVVEARTPAPR